MIDRNARTRCSPAGLLCPKANESTPGVSLKLAHHPSVKCPVCSPARSRAGGGLVGSPALADRPPNPFRLNDLPDGKRAYTPEGCLWRAGWRLPVQAQGKLDLPGIFGGADLAEVRGPQNQARTVKVGVVGEVK